MKRCLLAAATLALSGCASMHHPGATPPPAAAATAGFSEQMISANRYRVSYEAPAGTSTKDVADRTMAHAAQLTLDKGNQWFEIKDQASAPNKRTMEIVMGKGETLAGGRTYDAKETLAAMKAAAKKPAKTS
jgi:hypothetical protein